MISGAVVCSRLAIDPPLDWAARAAGVPHRPSIAVTPAANKPCLLPRGNSHGPTHSARRAMKSLLVATAVVVVSAAIPTFACAAPSKPAVWGKTVGIYKTQARQHGLTTACSRWSAVVSPTCEITRGGELVGTVIPSWGGSCALTLKYVAPMALSRSVAVDYCKPRWWTKPLPAPWSKSA